MDAPKLPPEFSGSDISDSFHEVLTKSGVELSPRERSLAEAFFFSGAGTVFKLLDKAYQLADRQGFETEEAAAVYATVFNALETEIATRGQEHILQAFLKLIRTITK